MAEIIRCFECNSVMTRSKYDETEHECLRCASLGTHITSWITERTPFREVHTYPSERTPENKPCLACLRLEKLLVTAAELSARQKGEIADLKSQVATLTKSNEELCSLIESLCKTSVPIINSGTLIGPSPYELAAGVKGVDFRCDKCGQEVTKESSCGCQ